MLRVAVTGGIGSGKSTVAAQLAARGAVVVDSDVLAREVVAVGSAGLAAVAARFGAGILTGDGALDRPALAAVVFSDPAARRDLEAIIHPRVRAGFAARAAAAPDDTVVVNDIPLLTELSAAAEFHLVVGVGADAGLRIRRLVGRGLAQADARARIAAQIHDAARRPLTDVWIDNAGTADDLAGQVDVLWDSRLVPFRDGLLQGRPAPRSGPVLCPADPEWPVTAARLLTRVGLAVGAAARTLDHIGSTAVPGLAAKDVIDLQLGVDSLDVVAGLSPALARAGFVVADGVEDDTPHPPDDDQVRWRKVFLTNVDPGRAVNLHVRAVGGPGWRWATAFRDWLTADSAARSEYLAVKQRLAAEHAADIDTDGYALAKESWFAAAAPRLAAWSASR